MKKKDTLFSNHKCKEMKSKLVEPNYSPKCSCPPKMWTIR